MASPSEVNLTVGKLRAFLNDLPADAIVAGQSWKGELFPFGELEFLPRKGRDRLDNILVLNERKELTDAGF